MKSILFLLSKESTFIIRKILKLRLLNLILLLSICSSCQQQDIATNHTQNSKEKAQIETGTKQLLSAFLAEEDMGKMSTLLADSIKFHWPDKTILDKAGLMRACTELVAKHDNQIEIIDLVIEDNRAFILFIWSGVVKEDENSNVIGQKFSIHDCWYLTWENGKVIEWYTIWGSMDYLFQLGYQFMPPSGDLSGEN